MSRSPDWAGIAAVVAVALAASLAGLGNDFAWDDGPLLVLDSRLHGLGRWREILTGPFWPAPWHEEHYRPLTSFLLAVQYALGGGAPGIFRVTSYFLYAVTAAGVFVLAARLLPRGVALAVALLFAAHPVHVEAVAPAASQSELLVGLFAVLMTIRYLGHRRAGAGALRPRDWAVLGLLYVAASLSKEHGMLLPALLLAGEVFLVRGPASERVRQLWGGYALLAGLALGMVLLRLALLGGRFSGQWTTEALDGLTLGGRALTMLAVVPEWARLLIWPAHLRVDYGPQEMVASTGFGSVQALGLALILGLVLAIWWARRAAPGTAFGLTWMAVTLLPASQVLLPTGSLIAERVLFLPSVGFLLAVGGLAGIVAARLNLTRARMRAAGALCGVLVVAGVVRSAERHRVWRHEALLSVRGVQDSPRSYRMQRAYGDVLFQLGAWDLARQAYQRAIELAPPSHVWQVRNDLARRFREQGETQLEVYELLASLAQVPEQEDTRGYLIAAYLLLGRYADAAREADLALAGEVLRPEVFRELRGLADSAAEAGAPPGTVRVGIRTGR